MSVCMGERSKCRFPTAVGFAVILTIVALSNSVLFVESYLATQQCDCTKPCCQEFYCFTCDCKNVTCALPQCKICPDTGSLNVDTPNCVLCDVLSVLPSIKNLPRFTNSDDGSHFVYSRKYIECKASFSMEPTTLSQLQEVITFALQHNYHVKAIGGGHTSTDTICTDGILINMKEFDHLSFDQETNEATVGAGMELSAFLEKIHGYGRGLTGAPSYGGVSIGGAVAAGTHGTNLKEAATLSDQLVSVTFVDGEGNIRELKEGDEDFKAMKVNLGLLGIVYELTFRTTEQYKLEMRNFPMSDEILWNGWEILDMAEDHDTFQFFWFPTNKQIVVMTGTKAPTNTSGNCRSNSAPSVAKGNSRVLTNFLEKMQEDEDELYSFYAQNLARLALYKEVPGRLPYYTKEDTPGLADNDDSRCLPVAVGFSHRIMTTSLQEGQFPLTYDEGTVLIDLSELEEALRSLKEITDEHLVEFPLVGINFRFVRESDAYMGLNRNSPSVQVEWISKARRDTSQPKLGISAHQAFGQVLVERHGGRPHWGKNRLHYLTHPIIQRAYPDLPKFIDVMNRMDPQEVFMNDFGRRLKHGSNEMPLTKAAKLRCALSEACMCQDDFDCGDGTPSALVCGDYKEFKICKKRPTPSNILKSITNRDAINSAGKFADDQSYLLEALAPYNGLRYYTD